VRKILDNKSSKPRVMLVLQFFEPEPVYKGQSFAEEIAKAGYEVEVVTGFPNYPDGKIYDGYRIRLIHRSKKNGILITRLPLFPSQNKKILFRILNYLSFMLSVFCYLTIFSQRSNLIYVYHPPQTVGIAVIASQLFRRTPVVLDIHDLWPDALSASGMISNPLILKVVDFACSWTYQRAQHIILHTDGFRKKLYERGVPNEKMTTVIGWADERNKPSAHFITSKTMDGPSGLRVLFAGNIGRAQDLDTVVDAAHLLQSEGEGKTATIFILGSGIALDALKDKVQKLGLYNVFFLPRVSAAKVGTYLAAADVLLIHLRDDPLFSLNIPSKLQAYMLAGKPIIMGAKGEAKRLLDDAVAGVSVPPGNPRKLAEAVLCLAAMPKHLRDKLGDNARNYYWRKLCMEKGMKIFFSIFKNVRSS